MNEILVFCLELVFGVFVVNTLVDLLFDIDIVEMVVNWIKSKLNG